MRHERNDDDSFYESNLPMSGLRECCTSLIAFGAMGAIYQNWRLAAEGVWFELLSSVGLVGINNYFALRSNTPRGCYLIDYNSHLSEYGFHSYQWYSSCAKSLSQTSALISEILPFTILICVV